MLDGGAALFKEVPAKSPELKDRAAFIADIYRQLGYDAVCVGSRDLAAGMEFLRRLERAGLPLISANLFYQGRRAFAPFKILEVKGLRIGVVGLTSSSIPLRVPDREKIAVKGYQDVLAEIVKDLEARTDYLILLSNIAPGKERKLLRQWPQFDLVISSGRVGATKSPVTTVGRPLVSTSALGKSMGFLIIRAEPGEAGRFSVRNRDVRLGRKIKEDKAVAGQIKAFLRRVKLSRSDPL